MADDDDLVGVFGADGGDDALRAYLDWPIEA
jgi:hypothetical protein